MNAVKAEIEQTVRTHLQLFLDNLDLEGWTRGNGVCFAVQIPADRMEQMMWSSKMPTISDGSQEIATDLTFTHTV